MEKNMGDGKGKEQEYSLRGIDGELPDEIKGKERAERYKQLLEITINNIISVFIKRKEEKLFKDLQEYKPFNEIIVDLEGMVKEEELFQKSEEFKMFFKKTIDDFEIYKESTEELIKEKEEEYEQLIKNYYETLLKETKEGGEEEIERQLDFFRKQENAFSRDTTTQNKKLIYESYLRKFIADLEKELTELEEEKDKNRFN